MKTKFEISDVSPQEINEAKYRVISVKFQCIVKMFDYGQKEPSMMFGKSKALPPQWFKSELKLPLEMVSDTDPYTLGLSIKEAYMELKRHIELYEK